MAISTRAIGPGRAGSSLELVFDIMPSWPVWPTRQRSPWFPPCLSRYVPGAPRRCGSARRSVDQPHADNAWHGFVPRRCRLNVKRRQSCARPRCHLDASPRARQNAQRAWYQHVGPRPRRWTGAAARQSHGSRSKLGATLGATAVHDAATLTGPHTLAEAVLLLPAAVVRLERALHGGTFSWNGDHTATPRGA